MTRRASFVLVTAALVGFAVACAPYRSEMCEDRTTVAGEVPVQGAAALDFDSADATVWFSNQAGDDRCAYDVWVVLAKGGTFSGCSVAFETTPLVDGEGRLLIRSVSLDTSSDCPTWGFDDNESLDTSGNGPFGTIALGGRVKGASPFECFVGSITVELDEVVLSDFSGNTRTIGPATLSLDVDQSAYGDSASCPSPAS